MNKTKNEKIKPLHISQVFNLDVQDESELDFFDANLYYDSLLFIDPFLIKYSPIEEERNLFNKFGIFFKEAHKKALTARDNEENFKVLINFLSFKEPREFYLGYTEKSNKGSGLGGEFAKSLTNFFLQESVRKIVDHDDLYPNKKFNPAIFALVTDKLGPDGLSDLSGSLLMDYFIKYTQQQCKKWNIDMKKMPVGNEFDYKEMEWAGGVYRILPENPIRRGESIVFVPKHFLRGDDELSSRKAKGRIVGILKSDPCLKEKFSNFLTKTLDEINIEDIKLAILQEESIVTKYLKLLEEIGFEPYDFNNDAMEFLAIKKYYSFFDKFKFKKEIEDCQDLLNHTKSLIDEFNKECTARDGWRDMWKKNKYCKSAPVREEVIGRKFRGMGFAYFKHLTEVTFIPEAGTGNGYVDFKIIHKDCRIVVELKKLSNSSSTGKPPLKAYLHGILRQLPDYIYLTDAKYGIYITIQHYNELPPKRKKGDKKRKTKLKNHTPRTYEIIKAKDEIEPKVKEKKSDFENLFYYNIDVSPQASASKK